MTHAIVKTTDGATYVSPLFAVKFAGGESAAIGLDPSLRSEEHTSELQSP